MSMKHRTWNWKKKLEVNVHRFTRRISTNADLERIAPRKRMAITTMKKTLLFYNEVKKFVTCKWEYYCKTW